MLSMRPGTCVVLLTGHHCTRSSIVEATIGAKRTPRRRPSPSDGTAPIAGGCASSEFEPPAAPVTACDMPQPRRNERFRKRVKATKKQPAFGKYRSTCS